MVSLNDEQKTAAQYDGDRLLVLGGPGTGKTTALIGRYIHLLNKGVDPKKFSVVPSQEKRNGNQ